MNKINESIKAGNFPEIDIKAVPGYKYLQYSSDVLLGEELQNLRDNPVFTLAIFKTYSNRINELDKLDQPQFYEQEVNCLINSGYCIDDANIIRPAFQDAFRLCPVVTHFDKILWYGAWVVYFSQEIGYEPTYKDKQSEIMDLMIYLLKLVQEKELKYGCSINLNKLELNTNIIQLIEADWSTCDKKYFNKITDLGIQKIKELKESQERIRSDIFDDLEGQKRVAEETGEDWCLFIDVFNEISSREYSTIQIINNADSPKDKIRAINRYFSFVDMITKSGKLELGERIINLLELYEKINYRMSNAPQFCVVSSNENRPFVLYPISFVLVMNPLTYNYFLLAFHSFRIDPTKESARRFFTLALSSIKKNFGEEETECIGINETIDEFYRTVKSFFQQNKSIIKELSYKNIQEDSIIPDATLIMNAESDAHIKDLSKRIKEVEDNDIIIEELEKAILGKIIVLDEEKLNDLIYKEEERSVKIEKEVFARQIVVSLNIIYIFCATLKNLLTNKQSIVKIKDREKVEGYRKELLRIDDEMVRIVYSDLDEYESNMREHREITGVDTSVLSEREYQEEKYRNSAFSDVLKDTISEMIEDIENKNVDQIIDTKNLIKQRIMSFPDCDEKEQYMEWMDSISSRLSEVLINNCKKVDDFIDVRNKLVEKIGDKNTVLPLSTMDSLTTAELLYDKYATEEFSEKGFDFSCISALYYQAFEEAYNCLIWQGYADLLNSLTIDGQKYTNILDSCKNGTINVNKALGYLESDSYRRSFYIDYMNRFNPETKVKSRCMYRSFAIIMEKVNDQSGLYGFCDYISKLAGYSSRNEMFCDNDFMEKCRLFASSIDCSTNDRNNASHGGTYISIDQCKQDKKAVLYDLEAIRDNSIGLIQQLLGLLEV